MEDREFRVEAIAKFARRLAALGHELAKASDDLANSLSHSPNVAVRQATKISPDETVRAYQDLRKQCEDADADTLQRTIDEFVRSHSKQYIRVFIQSNDLPLSTRDSKNKVAKELRQLLLESAAISAPLLPVRTASSR